MKKAIFLTLVFLNGLNLMGQATVKEWMFKQNNNPNNINIGWLADFSTGIPVFRWDTIGCGFTNTLALIQDNHGNRLFYSNGSSVFNKRDSIMLNSVYYNSPYYNYTDSIMGDAQRASPTILPFPNDTSKYYLVHQPIGNLFWTDAYGWANSGLYYSVIDMDLQNGLGDMSLKEVPILENDTIIFYPNYTFTRHGNGKDWWLVVPRMNVDSVYVFMLTDMGVVKYPPQSTMGGNQGDAPFMNRRSNLRFSPDGSKLGAYFQRGDTYVYDFNRCTGELSNPVSIPLPTDCSYNGYMGFDDLLFSNNNTKLYLSLRCRVEQYDLTASDINGSRVTIYSTSNNPANGNEFTGYMMYGPDRKVYIMSYNGYFLDVINFPDLSGSVCQYEHNLYTFLPNGTSAHLPLYPNYELGPLQGSLCDTISTVSIQEPDIESVKVYPNPASDLLTVEILSEASLTLRNTLGQEILQKAIPQSGKTQINIRDIPEGIYFYEILHENKEVYYGKVIIQRE